MVDLMSLNLTRHVWEDHGYFGYLTKLQLANDDIPFDQSLDMQDKYHWAV